MGTRDHLAQASPELHDATDADTVDGVRPTWVATPRTAAEAAALMRACADHGLAVVARGGGTKLTWGAPPARVDVVVDTGHLNQVVEHAGGDLVVVAQAGVRLVDLQKHLASTRQRLALDETVPGSTVGGIIAASPSGPRRMATGTVRDLLIGVTMVRADGQVAKAGGKVVKNVAGYDLGKLLTGSFGTLGLITEAVFRLHPVPAASRWVSAPVDGDLGAVLRSVLTAKLVPSALEVDQSAGGQRTVAVLVEGIPTGVEHRADTVAGLLGGAAEQAEDGPPWGSTYPWPAGGVALKLTCVLSAVPDVLAAAADASVAVRGSAGTGVLYGTVEPDRAAEAVAALRPVCVARGGSLVVLDAPAEVKAGLDLWGPVAGLELMRRVKDQFDPEHRLAPGRFVGGI
ncbi:MAG TPA: FAD-binding oxidoreductase [Pseudonocardiaceae bacterium]|nr:FAD-binding oxidoreductase [Pseudonocardiaceae bacterium]